MTFSMAERQEAHTTRTGSPRLPETISLRRLLHGDICCWSGARIGDWQQAACRGCSADWLRFGRPPSVATTHRSWLRAIATVTRRNPGREYLLSLWHASPYTGIRESTRLPDRTGEI